MTTPTTLASERIIVAGPMSITGAWKRTGRMLTSVGEHIDQPALRIITQILIGSTIGLIYVAAAATWTAATMVCLFPLTVVWRTFRGRARNRKIEAARHAEMMQAVYQQKD